jgi:hypothetical protein
LGKRQLSPNTAEIFGLKAHGKNNDYELRDFAPIGMLECWKTGIMGFGELTEWIIGKIKLANHKRNEKS